jgi:xylulose-5-phosphate/fructose-6-phosphate phosphoketolase
MKAASWGMPCRTPIGAAFDNPDLIVACVIGDGEAEDGPLATSWHSNKFLNPLTDGVVLAHPAPERLQDRQALRPRAHQPRRARPPVPRLWVRAALRRGQRSRDHAPAHGRTLDGIVHDLERIKADAQQATDGAKRPLWPMIVLRSPKGWTCPKEIDGKRTEDYWRSHQVPMGDMNKPEHIKILETWMKSYRPEELFALSGASESGGPVDDPGGERRMSANPHGNGGLL